MFVHTKIFDKKWDTLGLDEDDLLELQEQICKSPSGHPVIRGSGGVRKIRFAAEGKGKSGGARVIYGDFPAAGVVYLFSVYPKSEKDDITTDERKTLKLLMEQISKSWRDR